MRAGLKKIPLALLLALMCAASVTVRAQNGDRSKFRRSVAGDHTKHAGEHRGSVHSVTIPVTVRTGGARASAELQTIDLLVLEDGEIQETLSIRGANRSPLELAVLIQDNLVSSIDNDISSLASFIRHLPAGTRVMVGYLGSGSLQVRQRFTTDLDRAAKSLRIPLGSPSGAPYNPYALIVDALKRFESQPTGRRAVLVVSDGLDLSHGIDSSTPSQSIDLQRAINEAQRRGVAVYSIYAPAVGSTANGGLTLVGNAQGSLSRLSEETGGHAYFQGTSAPVSFDPFLRELTTALGRQLALTYLSTHPDKGFHRIQIRSAVADAKIAHPSGYTH